MKARGQGRPVNISKSGAVSDSATMEVKIGSKLVSCTFIGKAAA